MIQICSASLYNDILNLLMLKPSSKDALLKYMFCYIFLSLGITLLELASDLDLPRGGYTWHQLRNGQLPDVFTQGLNFLNQHKTHVLHVP